MYVITKESTDIGMRKHRTPCHATPERQNEVYVQKEKHVVYSIDKKPFHVWINNGLESGERVLANREAKPSRRPYRVGFLGE